MNLTSEKESWKSQGIDGMLESLYKLALSYGSSLVYTAGGSRRAGKYIFENDFTRPGLEVSVNEKAAFEAALAGAIASKRTTCLFSVEGVYETLDPLMTSAYTGVKGGLVVVGVKDQSLDLTPLGPFSKLPVMVSDGTPEDLFSILGSAFDLSERYEIPCLVETLAADSAAPFIYDERRVPGKGSFVKDPDRWAALPKARYELHRALNDKVERIREEFENYRGNERVGSGPSGTVTHQACKEGMAAQGSLLKLASVFPLPRRLVSAFIEEMDHVTIVEGPCPALEIQIPEKDRIRGRLNPGDLLWQPEGHAMRPEQTEILFGLRVVRDELGPASSINIAHGLVSSAVCTNLLAVTDEDSFFHSGLPAFTNTLYNGSNFLLLIETKNRVSELERVLEGFGFRQHVVIGKPDEIGEYNSCGRLTVLFWEGVL
jgi:TPP-dependent indolepyruvate ferredoxin oxidoreductase alpha subunit